ncbi:serine hydrolase [Sporolactobacillus sp. THM7-4]|nr:serine hydrolase [Sporolactobacillus sp. THM7-4]
MGLLKEEFINKLKSLTEPLGDQIAIAAEGSDGFRFLYNESVPMLSASLIKLPVLLYVYDQAKIDRSILKKTIVLRNHEIVGGSGVLQILSGREWSVRDLLALMINVSDNTATNLLIEEFGIRPIQQWVREHGYKETTLERKMMDTAAEDAGKRNLISARDACQAIRTLFSDQKAYPDEIKSWFLHQQFRGKLPGLIDEVPNPVSVYNKTGEMEEIDHDAAFFSYKSSSMSIAVLTSGVKDRQIALSVIQKIGKSVSDYLIQSEEHQEDISSFSDHGVLIDKQSHLS